MSPYAFTRCDTTVCVEQNSPLRRLAGAIVGLYSLLPVLKEKSSFKDYADMPSQVHAGLSFVLGWLLVFRINTAYARWWEARTLWGTLVNASRNLRSSSSALQSETGRHRVFAKPNRSLSQSTAEHLRHTPTQ